LALYVQVIYIVRLTEEKIKCEGLDYHKESNDTVILHSQTKTGYLSTRFFILPYSRHQEKGFPFITNLHRSSQNILIQSN